MQSYHLISTINESTERGFDMRFLSFIFTINAKYSHNKKEVCNNSI